MFSSRPLNCSLLCAAELFFWTRLSRALVPSSDLVFMLLQPMTRITNYNQNTLAPINQLPIEVLCLVFSSLLDTLAVTSSRTRKNRMRSLLAIAHVCRPASILQCSINWPETTFGPGYRHSFRPTMEGWECWLVGKRCCLGVFHSFWLPRVHSLEPKGLFWNTTRCRHVTRQRVICVRVLWRGFPLSHIPLHFQIIDNRLHRELCPGSRDAGFPGHLLDIMV